MYEDKELEFSVAQAITVDAISAHVYDRGSGSADAFEGDRLELVVHVTEAFATLTSLTIALVSADDAALTTNKTVHVSRSILLANLTLNNVIRIGVPLGPSRRYIGVDYDVVGTTATAGKVSAWLMDGNSIQANPPSLT